MSTRSLRAGPRRRSRTARAGFAALGALSTDGISRPFDARRDGFVMGEGAGVLVVEAAEHAPQRGTRPLGRLGYGASSDAFHITAPDMTGAGEAEAILAALDDAGVEPEQVVYVNAHGTSTPPNDRAETAALERALGARARSVPAAGGALRSEVAGALRSDVVSRRMGARPGRRRRHRGHRCVDGRPIFCYAQDPSYLGGVAAPLADRLRRRTVRRWRAWPSVPAVRIAHRPGCPRPRSTRSASCA